MNIPNFEGIPPHPLSFGRDSGTRGMKQGDIVVYANADFVRVDEFLEDGDALVTWANGSHGEVKWSYLRAQSP